MAVVSLFVLPRTAASQTSCADLAKLPSPDVTVTAAEQISNGTYIPPGPNAQPQTNMPAFCRVALTVKPQIHIEVWLPTDSWNGRFKGEGGGGYAGAISYGALIDDVRDGYATASTDTGHTGPSGTFALNADGTLNTPLISDFAERSLRALAAQAKALITAYYGTAPKYSYWNGCSTGGRQGLMAAQRFPDEYDGLLIGAPAINWDRFIPSELWPQVVMRQDVGAPIAASKLTAVTAAAVAACDADDGVKDGVINDPRKCTFDPAALVCKEGADPASCLTPAEARAVRRIWDGPVNAKGERLWFGLERGASLAGLAGGTPFPIASTYFQSWIHQDPAFDWHTVTETGFESDFRASQQKFHDVIGTDDPNLDRFRRHGGKMILWHGEADQLIFPRGTVNYVTRVAAASGGAKTVDRFARLFLAPGVGHCGGGAGPAPIGAFDALVNWVEQGVAPDTLRAARTLENGTVRTRPLCAYPKTARWTGSGSTDDAANFTCVDGHPDPRDVQVADPVSSGPRRR